MYLREPQRLPPCYAISDLLATGAGQFSTQRQSPPHAYSRQSEIAYVSPRAARDMYVRHFADGTCVAQEGSPVQTPQCTSSWFAGVARFVSAQY